MGRVFRSRNKINHPPEPKGFRITDFATRIPNRRPIIALSLFGCLRLLIRPANDRRVVCTPSKSDQWPLFASCISPHGECISSARPSATGFLLPLSERWLFAWFSPLYHAFLHFLMFRACVACTSVVRLPFWSTTNILWKEFVDEVSEFSNKTYEII